MKISNFFCAIFLILSCIALVNCMNSGFTGPSCVATYSNSGSTGSLGSVSCNDYSNVDKSTVEQYKQSCIAAGATWNSSAGCNTNFLIAILTGNK